MTDIKNTMRKFRGGSVEKAAIKDAVVLTVQPPYINDKILQAALIAADPAADSEMKDQCAEINSNLRQKEKKYTKFFLSVFLASSAVLAATVTVGIIFFPPLILSFLLFPLMMLGVAVSNEERMQTAIKEAKESVAALNSQTKARYKKLLQDRPEILELVALQKKVAKARDKQLGTINSTADISKNLAQLRVAAQTLGLEITTESAAQPAAMAAEKATLADTLPVAPIRPKAPRATIGLGTPQIPLA